MHIIRSTRIQHIYYIPQTTLLPILAVILAPLLLSPGLTDQAV